MKILVIGGGGREHAMVWKLSQSPKAEKIYCIPGNPGIAQFAECIDNVSVTDKVGLSKFAIENKIDLTIVGPETPLVAGVTDHFRELGLKIFGPNANAAQIESSKSFAKNLMIKYNIPTSASEVFTDAEEAISYIKKQQPPIVIKADGLAAGKGVIIALTHDEAINAIQEIMVKKIFGDSGNKVVIEEFLTGEEASVLAFTDGYTVIPMLPAQDHKRIFEGDTGPNTGGMGAYAPAPVVTEFLKAKIVVDILEPIINALREEGCIYSGCIYAGLMITKNGPKVIEFNARFGDPETQAILPLLKSDLVDIMDACANGENKLQALEDEISWYDGSNVCIILSSKGYPGEFQKGDVITGIKEAENENVVVFHAGTTSKDSEIQTSGGRVLGVTAKGQTIIEAVENGYAAVSKINFDGMHFRRDIAYRAMY